VPFGINRETTFRVYEDALQDDTYITMSVLLKEVVDEEEGLEYNELINLFGPCGTQFSTPSLLKVPFELLLTYEIEDFTVGLREEGADVDEDITFDIDVDNELVLVYIPHFSQYYFPRR
jgi:hypothetical protein